MNLSDDESDTDEKLISRVGGSCGNPTVTINPTSDNEVWYDASDDENHFEQHMDTNTSRNCEFATMTTAVSDQEQDERSTRGPTDSVKSSDDSSDALSNSSSENEANSSSDSLSE
ncbi:hypothetical protein QAD02_003322 [Eretmocerus hayati]|uniref:Uncharacterized protein n=1 Tax=Eretmocerus hayati TaxID=131215 RepID=A0ACC2NMM1_9HYME|nr:hypothetical protein QAD02_003322 [Eretmocerus hayati]